MEGPKAAGRLGVNADRSQKRHEFLVVLLILCSAAVVLRLAFVWHILVHYGASYIYGIFESCRIAASIVDGHGFSSPYGIPTGPTAWLPPVYPYVVAAVFKLFGVYSIASLWCLILVNIGCETLIIVLLFRIGLRCFGPVTAFLGSFLWTVEPGVVVYSVRIWESSLSALLATLAVLLYLHLLESPPRSRDWVFYALFWAFAAMTNTALLALMPLPVAVLLFCKWHEVRRHALVALVVFGCALAPWTIRNYMVFHKFIPIRGNFGPNLWYGNHPGVQGPTDQSLNPAKNPHEFAIYRELGDAGYAQSRQEMALEFIRHHPAEFFHLSWARVAYVWTASDTFRPLRPSWVSFLAFGGLLFMWRNTILGIAPFASALLLFPLPYYVTHCELSYFHPIEPAVGLLLAYTIITLVNLAREVLYSKKQYQTPF